MKIFIDTSFWISYLRKNERNHTKAVEWMKVALDEGHRLFTSNDVIDETLTRLVYKELSNTAKKFYSYFLLAVEEGAIQQLWTDEVIQKKAAQKIWKFKEHSLSMTDATAVIIIELHKLDAVATFDSDFQKIGIKVVP